MRKESQKGKEMNLIMEKIRAITNLKAENRDLKEKIKQLEQVIENLEQAASTANSRTCGGIGGFGRQR